MIRKRYQYITTGLVLLVITNISVAGVNCHDFIGTWTGSLHDKNQTLQSVELNINDMFGKKTYGASINYTTQSDHEDRFLNGECRINGDHADLHLRRNVMGVNADMYLTLIDNNTLKVDAYRSEVFGVKFVYHASGTLKR